MYYLDNLENDFYHAGNKARKDCKNIFKNLKMKRIKISYFLINENIFIYRAIDQLISLLFSIKFLFKKNILVFFQFPAEKRWSYFFYNLKNIKIVSIIHDLEGLRFKDGKKLKKEIEYLNKSKYIVSHNSEMTEFLIKNGVNKNKIKNLNIFDYILEEDNRKINKIKTSDVCFAGNLEKSLFIYELKKLNDIKLDIFGVNYQEEKNQGDFNYCGAYPPDEIHKKLSGKYGLIWDGDSLKECNGVYGEYLKYNNPHKFSLYIAAGLPVITWEKAAIAEFIKKENIGITVDSLYDLKKILANLTKKEYEEKVENVLKIRDKIINGDILKNLIMEILNEDKNE